MLDLEDSDIFLLAGDSLAEPARVAFSMTPTGQAVPAAADDLGRAHPAQPFELEIGVDHAFGRAHLRDRDRHRDMIEELLELFALERMDEIGRVEQTLDLLRLVSHGFRLFHSGSTFGRGERVAMR